MKAISTVSTKSTHVRRMRPVPGPVSARRLGLVSGLACTMLMGACASSRPQLEPAADSQARLDNLDMRVVIAEPPSFYADTPGRRLFGMLGAFSMASSGNELVERYRLKDPSTIVAGELGAALVQRHRLHVREGAANGSDAAREPELELRVDTINWDFRPFRGDGNRMYVVYTAQARLMDLKRDVVLASGRCRAVRTPDDGEGDGTTVDHLLDRDAELLRSELQKAGHDCATRLKRDSFHALLESHRQLADNSPAAKRLVSTSPGASAGTPGPAASSSLR